MRARIWEGSELEGGGSQIKSLERGKGGLQRQIGGDAGQEGAIWRGGRRLSDLGFGGNGRS
jgi:hypothetical protein